MAKTEKLVQGLGKLYELVEALDAKVRKLEADPELIQLVSDLGINLAYYKKNKDALDSLTEANRNVYSDVYKRAQTTLEEANELFTKALAERSGIKDMGIEIERKYSAISRKAAQINTDIHSIDGIVQSAISTVNSEAQRAAETAAESILTQAQAEYSKIKREAAEDRREAEETLSRARELVEDYDPEAGYSWRQVRKTGKTVGIGVGLGAVLGSALVYLCMPESEIMIKEQHGYNFDGNKELDTALWEIDKSGKIKRDERGKLVVYGGRFDNGDIETGDRIKKLILQQESDVRKGRIPKVREIVSNPTYKVRRR